MYFVFCILKIGLRNTFRNFTPAQNNKNTEYISGGRMYPVLCIPETMIQDTKYTPELYLNLKMGSQNAEYILELYFGREGKEYRIRSPSQKCILFSEILF